VPFRLLDLAATPYRCRSYIYAQQHGGNGAPALSPLGTIMLVMSFVIVTNGYLGHSWMTRGERGGRRDALTTIAGM
jgi:hypothetical protein